MSNPDRLSPLPPAEAIAFFRSKGLAESFAWEDVWQEEHARAFTVAKAMQREVLEDIRAALDDALAEGRTLAQFREELTPVLQARGWWGRQEMEDPLTGEMASVQLGSPRRLRTIFETNMRSAYQAGLWQRIERSKSIFPFLRYSAVMDGRTRPEHRAWHGTVLPVDDPWWDAHYPPCGFRCRCTVTQMNGRTLARRGFEVTEAPPRFPARTYTNRRTGEVTTIEGGISPGFNFNVGKAYLQGVAPTLAPEGGEIREGAASDYADAIEAFLRAFDATEADRVWTDREGYPQIIGPSLFRNAAGSVVTLSSDQVGDLDGAAATLKEPDSISWVWVRQADGSALLMRQYRRRARPAENETVVDIASGGSLASWRFRTIA